jgi:hypothetical protein
MSDLRVNSKGRYFFKPQNILHEIHPNSFSNKIKNAIRFLVFNPNREKIPVGSFMFRSQKFSDIDLLDNQTRACCSWKEAKEYFKTKIQNMVYRIKQYKEIYFSNVKAGVDSKGEGVKWTEEEVLRGYKEIDGIYKDLGDAIAMDGICNIEIWSKVQGRYIEISNFLVMEWFDENGVKHPLNAPMYDLIPRVKEDVKKYQDDNTFKASKRMWILARNYNDMEMLEKLQVLLSSDAGDLYIILSDIETIYLMLETLGSQAPYDDLMIAIDEIKVRIARIWNVPIDHDAVTNIINFLLKWNVKTTNRVMYLKEIHKYLKSKLNKYTKIFNEEIGIFPIPRNYLP